MITTSRMETQQDRPLRVIIESPYAGDIERNTLYARRAMRDSITRGEAPFASHLLYTQSNILDENNPAERKLGIECGFAWWNVADTIIFYTDYGTSPGMEATLERAIKQNKLFLYRSIDPNPESQS